MKYLDNVITLLQGIYDNIGGGAGSHSMIETTYAEIKALRDNGELIPGAQYRITDYICKTYMKDTRSAEHQYDVIVTADDNKTLNENARAIQHEGDEYFKDCNLAAWELKFSIDAKSSFVTNGAASFMVDDDWLYLRAEEYDEDGLFAWAYYDDSTSNIDYDDLMFTQSETPLNGDIVIQDGEEYEIYNSQPAVVEGFCGDVLFLKDENNNSCYYDFKNIQYKRFQIIACEQVPSLVGKYIHKYETYIELTDEFVWCFTFNRWDAENNEFCEGDASLYGVNNNEIGYNSKDIVIFGNECNCNTFGKYCNFNTLGFNCHNNSFGNYCIYNIFNNDCNYNTLSNTFQCNIFGLQCTNNFFSEHCSGNTLDDNCDYNFFSNNCCNNIFGFACTSNTFYASCIYNTLGKHCQSNKLGSNCDNNTFDDDCYYNTLCNSCRVNTFGNVNQSNFFGNNCEHNSFGNNCSYNSFGNNCKFNTFGDSSSTKSFVRYIELESGVQYTYITTPATTSNFYYLQNVHINSGVCGTSDTSRKTISISYVNIKNLITVGSTNDTKINV